MNRRRALSQAGALALAAAAPIAASAAPPNPPLPPEVRAVNPLMQLVGTGQLRFFGLLVYEARLWATPGFKGEAYDSQPIALELEYARKLDGPAIAERSIAEMRRIGPFSDEQARQWLALMMQAFPSVVAKDRLVGEHDGKGRVRFMHNGKVTAELNDRDYARLFFGIWLHPQTSAPALRRTLLGQAS